MVSISRGVLAFLVAAVAVGAAAGVTLTSETGTSAPTDVVREGDTVLVDLTFYDLAGRMVFSTKESDLAEMEAVAAEYGPGYVLPPTEGLHPLRYNVTADAARRPVPIDGNASLPLLDGLVGKPVGHAVVVPVAGRFTGFTETIELERTRGPFPMEMPVGEALFEKIATPLDDGRYLLDDLLPARVLSRDNGTVHVRLDLEHGQGLTVRDADLPVTVLLNEGGDAFDLHLDAEEGHRFSLFDACSFAKYVLPNGSYQVTSVDATTITLLHSPTKLPQLLDKDLVVALEIAGIETR